MYIHYHTTIYVQLGLDEAPERTGVDVFVCNRRGQEWSGASSGIQTSLGLGGQHIPSRGTMVLLLQGAQGVRMLSVRVRVCVVQHRLLSRRQGNSVRSSAEFMLSTCVPVLVVLQLAMELSLTHRLAIRRQLLGPGASWLFPGLL